MKKTTGIVLATFIVLLSATGLYAEIMLTPSISVRGEYTDNVDRVNEDREYDYITSVMPSLTMEIRDKAIGATLSYQPSWNHYERTEDYDYWRHLVSLQTESQLGRHVRMTIGGSYLQSEDERDAEDPTIPTEPDYTRREGRYKYYTYAADAGLEYQFGERDVIGMRFDYGGTENDEPTLEDSSYYRPSIDFTYWFTQRWGTEFSGEYERGMFDAPENVEQSEEFDRYFGQGRILHQFNRQLTGNVQYAYTLMNYDEETDDERTHDFSSGFDYLIAQDMTLALQVGYSIVEIRGDDNESGMSGTLDFAKMFQRGSIGIHASSGYDYSYYDAENLGLNYYVGAGMTADYKLSRRLSANVHADYRYSEYKDLTPDREDDYLSTGCGLSYQLLPWLSAGAGYTYSLMDSSEDDNDYRENRVFISLTATPIHPLRLND
ncbi:outer membrane beta-barrel protein [uncultured Desulfosarcina sp.]|uniref:outer membrane beta-barrel protein n=1 Tax=uncultured Desulfosarcina sp. TaxID=218289 RepID=UPI0029C61A09|nr:outer membrane beta-barrel protein [uncultured Desulfosarcina sp.]